MQGETVGRHSGLALYTLGQRKGINIGGTGPYYVVGKDYKKNQLIVTNDSQKISLFSVSAVIGESSWVGEKLSFLVRFLVRTRYRNKLVYATIKKSSSEKGKIEVKFEKPQRVLTPGQSIVFYTEKGEIVGGGIVAEAKVSRTKFQS